MILQLHAENTQAGDGIFWICLNLFIKSIIILFLIGKNCECAVFNVTKVVPGLNPIMYQQLLQTGCDERGEKDCLALCANLAQLSKEKGPQIVCANLGHVDNLKVINFYCLSIISSSQFATLKFLKVSRIQTPGWLLQALVKFSCNILLKFDR